MASNDNNEISKDEKKREKWEEKIKRFLNENDITEKDLQTTGWYKLMMEENVRTELITVLKKLGHEYRTKDYKGNRVPAYNRVLKAFTLVRPDEVKVLVIGTSPALSVGAEGGVAFSSSAKRTLVADGAVKKFRKALEDGLTKKTGRITNETGLNECNFNLEDWAKKNKVLLLNAGLTMTGPSEKPDKIRRNCVLWESFMKQLLKAWRKSRNRSNQQPQTTDGVGKVTEEINKLKLEKTTTRKQQEDNNKVHVLLLGYKHPGYENSVHYSKQVWDLPEKENTDATLVVYENVHHPTFPGQNDEETNNFEGDAPAFFTAAFPQ